MKTEEKVKIIKDELHRFKVTKSACDSCIPQDLIDCHEELIQDLRELENFKKHILLLRKKHVNAYLLLNTNNHYEYNNTTYEKIYPELSKDEYSSSKEIYQKLKEEGYDV